ncbi:hypothetical protein TNIN_419061 [Trichonephila inaurata madagascariensis]|uniref:Uncharacterized protein n=1 Tax=Trichonephila inaurata madagascariensis TaxID=2747483 RepID=A0A8X7CG50_9ARAC|nr:hypothetical protein TNIN_419061 [Trichonephila inaurata madagascariensis]
MSWSAVITVLATNRQTTLRYSRRRGVLLVLFQICAVLWSLVRSVSVSWVSPFPLSSTTCAGKACHARHNSFVTESPMTWYVRRHEIVTETKTTCVARQVELLSEYRSSVHCIAYSYKYLTHILKWKEKVTLTTSFRQIEKENTMVVIVTLMK